MLFTEHSFFASLTDPEEESLRCVSPIRASNLSQFVPDLPEVYGNARCSQEWAGSLQLIAEKGHGAIIGLAPCTCGNWGTIIPPLCHDLLSEVGTYLRKHKGTYSREFDAPSVKDTQTVLYTAVVSRLSGRSGRQMWRVVV